ncbi:MAG: UxaA family hydrolase [Firmicutes bacterium]|nr:UxaA family hydrolase [Bacillota bacterium]
MNQLKFKGYLRPDGKVGVRNHILILPTSVCSSDVAKFIAAQVPDAVTFSNPNGCAQVGRDLQFTLDILSGYACNPNVYGTVLVSLGCETCQLDLVASEIEKRTNKPLIKLDIQESGGSIKAVEKGVRAASQLSSQAACLEKDWFPITELMIGTECGGSDPTSGLAANPTVGAMSDLAVEAGATVILSETTEFIGAEHILARRAVNKEVGDRIFEIVYRYEEDLKLVGEDVRAGNPSPGNKAGGLTTLEEKSLGCIHKSGHAPIQAVFEYAQPVTGPGLVIMDTPGYDAASIAGMVAGGCQVCVFTTGRGTPLGHPLIPVIKITGNKITYEKMIDNIDFDASPAVYGQQTIEEQGAALLHMVLRAASGEKPKAEALGFTETSIAKICNFT